MAVVRERHVVRVSMLSDLLGVSEVTVRRDLEELEHRGLVERTHGGAISIDHFGAEPSYLEAVERRAPDKRAIGRAAAELVRPGETIFMNGGTTTLQVFRNLRLAGLRVITNHVGIASEAADRELELIVVGGEYRAPSNSCVGAFATQTLRGAFAHRALIGVEGLSIRSGLTTPVAPEAEIARVMIEQTQGPIIVVADSTKVGTIADFSIAPIDVVTTLVTDGGLDEAYRDELASAGVEVVTSGKRAPIHVGVGHGEV